MIDVPREFQKALTAALGDRLGHLVVTSTREGAKAAHRLKEAGAGRSHLHPPVTAACPGIRAGRCSRGTNTTSGGGLFREGCEGLGNFLLQRCFVVEDMQQLWKSGREMHTRGSGDRWRRNAQSSCEISGGSHENGRDTVFEQRREIAALREKVALLEHELTRLQSVPDRGRSSTRKLSLESDRLRHF